MIESNQKNKTQIQTLQRTSSWEAKLMDFLQAREMVPIEIGKTDCVMLVIDAIEIMTETHLDELAPDHPFRGEYSNMVEAGALLRRYSGGGLENSWTKFARQIGLHDKPIDSAAFGDICIVYTEALIGGVHDIMGIIAPNGVIAQGKEGLVSIPLDKVKKVWGFGDGVMETRSWGIVSGCERLTPGCDNCPSYWEYQKNNWDYHPRFNVGILESPFVNKKPANYLVAVGSDIFHEAIRLRDIQVIFSAMKQSPWHTFEIITKRPERMSCIQNELDWPKNLKIGVAVESSGYRWRIDYLKKCPAEFKALQYGPITGPMGPVDLTGINKVIAIPEYWGPSPRPCKTEWIEDVKRQCKEQSVEFDQQHYLYNDKFINYSV